MSKYLEAIYDFTDRNGRLLFQKLRSRLSEPDKSGRMKAYQYRYRTKSGNVVYQKPPYADEIILNLPAVCEAVENGGDIFWPEGEKCAFAMSEAWDVVATSTHQGAGKLNGAQCQWLRGAERIILLPDMDVEHGVGALDLCLRYDGLVEAGVPRDRIVVVRAADGLVDVADHIAAGRTMRQLVRVTDLGPLRERAAKAAEAARTGASSWFGYPPEERDLPEPWHAPRVARRADGQRYLDLVVPDYSDARTAWSKRSDK